MVHESAKRVHLCNENRRNRMRTTPYYNAVYATWTAASMLELQLTRLQICKIVGLFWV